MIRIGDVVEVYCTRCRLNLDANVAAMADGEIKKVTCRTCDNEVPYKPPADLQQKKEQLLERLMRQRRGKLTPKAETRAELKAKELRPDLALRKLWDELTTNVDPRRARVYDKTRTLAEKDIVLHKQHGMGVVTALDATEPEFLATVLFREGFEKLATRQPPDEDEWGRYQ